MRGPRILLSLAVALGLLVPSGLAVAGRRSVPPPTPVPPFGSPSPYPTALETPPPSTETPSIEAASWALGDVDSGQVLAKENARERRPIASVTKVMTALLVLEAVRPEEMVTASPTAAAQVGAELGLKPGERLPVRELLMALLLQSANDAAVALAEHVAGSEEAFVERMNDRAHELGLRDTEFRSPSGLDDTGYSTARDLVAITAEAFRNETFAEVASTKFHRIPAPDGKTREIQNRNALLWLYPGASGVKTGYTFEAGFCLVAAAERGDLRLVAVVLGAPEQAFDAGAELLNHGFATYERRTVVEEGQSFEPLQVDGEEVPVSADVSLDLLIRRGQDVEFSVAPEPGLTLPVASGERVGTLMVLSEGQDLGRVPLVAERRVSPPAAPPPGDSWWESAWNAVIRLVAGMFRALFG